MGDCEESLILKSQEELGLTFPSPSLPAPAIAPSPAPAIDSDLDPASDPNLVPVPATDLATTPAIDSNIDPNLVPAPATDISPSPVPATDISPPPFLATDLAATPAIDSNIDPASDPNLVPAPAIDIAPSPVPATVLATTPAIDSDLDPASDPSLVPAPATDIALSPDPATTPAIDSDLDPASHPNLVPAAQETFYGEFQNLGLEENEIEKNSEEENHNDDKNENENLGWDSPVEEETSRIYQHPQGPNEVDCPHYVWTGTCKFGLKCRFNHPAKRKNQDVKEKEKELAGRLNCKETFYGEFQNLGLEENEIEKNSEENHNDYKNENENLGWDSLVEEEKGRRYQHPQGPDEEDCPHYIRTGTCKFGLNCRFNHPAKRKNQAVKEKEKEWAGRLECKYYSRTGGCKFGKACRYNHPREKTVVGPPQELNFLGLPIRLGEKECPFYMRTGSCKYGVDCRFHHPDPTAVGECDPPSVYLHSVGAPQPAATSWSSPRTSIETVPHFDASSSYVPVMLPPQGVHPNSEWNGYQAPAYPIEWSTHPPSALVVNNPTRQVDFSRHQQQQMLVEEFPERPGQPECRHFMRTGYCKFRSGCKFHHPKNPAPKLPVRSQ